MRWLLYVALAFFLWLMLQIIRPYLSFDTEVAFLRIKQQYINNKFWLISFFIHALVAVFTIPAGFTQFSKKFRLQFAKAHRRFGMIYIMTVLMLGAPSGFVLGLFANGRLPSRIGFTLLAVLWFYFTLKAYRFAQIKRFDLHQKFMIRSYALTLSAITLRIWKLVLARTIAPDPLLLYQTVTWLGFIPNLIIAEIIILRINQLKTWKSE